MEENNQRWVDGLRRGDSASFDEAYRFYRPRIYSFLARLTRDRATAEDLLQETWIRLARNALTLEEGTELGAWLFSVARNLFISHHRWRLIRLDEVKMLNIGGGHENPSPFDLASASETEKRLEAAIGKLPIAQREILLLVALEGFTPGEAAKVLGIPPDTARQRLLRARSSVASDLGDEFQQRAVGGDP